VTFERFSKKKVVEPDVKFTPHTFNQLYDHSKPEV